MTMKPTITFPPLTDCDGKHELVSSVTFAVGPYLPRCVCGGLARYVLTRYDVRVECCECDRRTDLCVDMDKAASEWRAMCETGEE